MIDYSSEQTRAEMKRQSSDSQPQVSINTKVTTNMIETEETHTVKTLVAKNKVKLKSALNESEKDAIKTISNKANQGTD